MTTVFVAKHERLTPFFERSFESESDALQFAETWHRLGCVTVSDESGERQSLAEWCDRHRGAEPADGPMGDPCPFCGADWTPILADDECLHACGECDRHWYIDNEGNVLPADRCPACESESITVFEDGRRRCGQCGHAFFFDGLTYVDPATLETESDGAVC